MVVRKAGDERVGGRQKGKAMRGWVVDREARRAYLGVPELPREGDVMSGEV